ncbi:hypothetical protein EBR77_01335 [bacterium]|nr:hypothetical protein [bacterium]
MKHNKTILCTIIGLFFYTPIFTKSDQPVDETKHLLVIHPDILERQAAQELESIPEPEIQAKPISTTGQAVLDIQMIIAGIANIIQKRREAKRLKKLNQTKRSPYYFDDEEDDFNVQDIMKQALQALQEHNDFMLEQEN